MTTNHHTAIATGANADASVFNVPLGQLDAQIANNAADILALQQILNIPPDESSVVISAGAITFSKTGTAVAPESGTSDDLDTINGGSAGDIVFITVDDDANSITVTSNGNIEMPWQTVVLTDTNSVLALRNLGGGVWGFLFAGNAILNPFVRVATIVSNGLDLTADSFKFAQVIKINGEGSAADDLDYMTPHASWDDGKQLVLKKNSSETITVKQNKGSITPKFFVSSDRVLDNTRDNLIVQLGGNKVYWENMGFNDNGV